LCAIILRYSGARKLGVFRTNGIRTLRYHKESIRQLEGGVSALILP